jgi:hypothetical protein
MAGHFEQRKNKRKWIRLTDGEVHQSVRISFLGTGNKNIKDSVNAIVREIVSGKPFSVDTIEIRYVGNPKAPGYFEKTSKSWLDDWKVVSEEHVCYLLDNFLIDGADRFEEETGDYSVNSLLNRLYLGRLVCAPYGNIRFVKLES